MNITHRFTLMVKSSITALFDSLEDPERSLHQLILDMEDEVEAAKRAAARAMANEDRLRQKREFHAKDAAQWQEAAERAMERKDEDEARDSLRRAELAERQRDKLSRQLEEQEGETEEIRGSIARMNDQVGQAKARLQLLQAKMRQGEARAAVNEVMRGVERRNLQAEFDRLSERIEDSTAEDRAYQRLDDELRGDDLRRRVEVSAVDDAVEARLERLRERTEKKKKTDRKKASGE